MRHIRVSRLAVLWFLVLLAGPARADTALAIAAAENHTCAVSSERQVLCWGDNYYGQLGDGTTTSHSTPIAVPGLSGIATVSTGGSFTCALTTAGAIWCWGNNASGQLGNGSTVTSLVPMPVSGLSSGVASISVGAEHACALTAEREAFCWGRNHFGQLGNGTSSNSAVPVPVSGLGAGTLQIAAAQIHTCAVAAGGAARCWGFMGSSLGDGVTTSSDVPMAVPGLESGVIGIAVGNDYDNRQGACAITQARAAWCWGNLDHLPYESVPTPISGLSSEVMAIGMGATSACALTISHAVLCWGESRWLGTGPTADGAPAPVYGLTQGVKSIAVGRNHRCALLQVGSLRCWGSPYQGQVGGLPAPSPSATPLPVVGLESGVTAISAGASQAGVRRTCAVQDGSAWCWGSLAGFPPHIPTLFESDVSDVSVGNTLTCVRKSNGAASCVDWSEFSLGFELDPGSVASIDAGPDIACIVTSVGGITCRWGDYSWVWIDLDSGYGYWQPVTRQRVVYASGMAAVSAIAASYECGLSTAGGVSCWSADGAPVTVAGLETGVVQIDRCHPYVCAVTASGSVLSWNYDAVATPVPGLSNVAAISGGYAHTCVLLHDATVHCWGDNSDLQLGVASPAYSGEPVQASLETGAVAIAAGGNQTCAITTLGGAVCWGANSEGQRGDGSVPLPVIPLPVVGFESAPQVPALGTPAALGLAATLLAVARHSLSASATPAGRT